MNYWVRFWVVLGSLLTGISAFGFLVMSFVFPDAALFSVSVAERLGVTFLAAASLGVVIWSSVTSGDVVGPNER